LMDYLVTEGLSENDGCGGGDIYGDWLFLSAIKTCRLLLIYWVWHQNF
jgi:hypothetical protein